MDAQTLLTRLRGLGANFTTGQLISLAASFVLVVAIVGGSAMWLNAPTYSLLFADMDQEAAGQVVTRLKNMKVPYVLDAGGRAIRVPSSRVDELRLELTAQGLPSSGRIGFEIFDRTSFGATEFVEQVNYRRALEGEIARTITALSEVSGARVHIAMGKDSLFGEKRPAKASVVLKLRDQRGLSPGTIAGISNLVAASVEGLRPEAVVILDSLGRPLSRPQEDDDLGAAHLERQQRLEREMATRLIALLEPVVGDGRVRVNVALKLNPRSREQTEERWDPNTAGDAPAAAAGPVLAGPGSSRQTETTNYEVSRTTTRTIEPPGDVARLSVAVILDDAQELRADGEGRQVLARVPRKPEELQKLHALVAASVGVDETRGDLITVENVSFEEPVQTEPPAAGFWTRYQAPLQEGGRVVAVLVLGLAALLFLRPVFRRAAAPRAAAAPAGLIPGGERPRTVAELEREIEAQLDAALADTVGQSRRLPVLTRRVAGMAQKEPATTAKLLRSLMAEQER